MFAKVYEGNLECLPHKELLEHAIDFRSKMQKTNAFSIKTIQYLQNELKAAKRRAWTAKKELKILKDAALKGDDGENGGDQKSDGNNSQMYEILKNENEELKREVKRLRKSNSDMNLRLVKILKVTRPARLEDTIVVQDYIPPAPPLGNVNFKITKSKTTDNVVEELKKKIAHLRKVKPGLFKNQHEFAKVGEGIGRKLLNAVDHKWDMEFESMGKVAKLNKEDENVILKENGEYFGKYRTEDVVLSTIKSKMGLSVGNSVSIKYKNVKSVNDMEKGMFVAFSFEMKDTSKFVLYLLALDSERFKEDLKKRMKIVS